MVKKGLVTSMVAATLLFIGCGEDDNGKSRLEIQHMLDKGEFNAVIQQLEGRATSVEDNIALASAYMGKAGYSLLEVGKDMASDNNDTITQLVGDDKPASSINDLDKAAFYYKKVVGENTCNEAEKNGTTLDDAQKDVCLFIGLSAVAKTATTLDLLADDVSAFSIDNNNNESNTTDYKLQASACAMQFAFDNNLSVTSSDDCTFQVAPQDVTFTLTHRVYRPLVVHVKDDENLSNNYHFLLTQEDNLTHTRSTALTKDYCTNDDFTRFPTYKEGLYACPINENPLQEETTSVGVLTDTLNGDIDSIITAAPEDNNGEKIGEDDVTEFKCDVINGEYNKDTKECIVTTEDNQTAPVDFNQREITEEEVISYINSRSKD